MAPIDASITTYAAEVTNAARGVEGVVVVASYLHGSAVLGGFAPGGSDVDLILVLESAPGATAARALGEALIAVAGCPGVGLEMSAVTESAAKAPAAPWPFVVHATSAPGDRKVVVGDGRPGDPDLALHYAVIRQSGHAIEGAPPEQLIGPIPRQVILRALGEELAWGLHHAGMAYAVLNAARALRYLEEDVLCSKLAGGEWAIAHGEPADLIQPALDHQHTGTNAALTSEQRDWINRVILRV